MRLRFRSARRMARATESLAALLLLAGCTGGRSTASTAREGTPSEDTPPSLAEPSNPRASDELDVIEQGLEVASSKHPNLQWKRHLAFEADLSRALELTPAELCTEFGSEPCIAKVHLVPLGGHEPFQTGLFEPASEPLATTPTIVDRVVMSACSNRAALDRQLGAGALVFRHFDLNAAAPAPADASTQAQVTDLYRRLLARDPETSELSAVAGLALNESGQPIAALDFAKLACFAVGTSSEFLFF